MAAGRSRCPSSSSTSGVRRTSCAARSTRPTSRATSSRCCSSSGSATSTTRSSQQALEESGGDLDYASFAENHRFQIPDGAHWSDVREKHRERRPARSRTRCAQIEKANPETLYGIFGDTQWTNKERLPDRLLRDLIEHFSKVPLGNASVAPDVARQRVRVPDQAVRRPLEQEGRRVLHAALGRADDGQHPRPAGGRDASTTRPAAPAAC